MILTFVILALGGMAYLKTSSKKQSTVDAKKGGKTMLRTVETQVLKAGEVLNEIELDGRLSAYEKIDLFAEVQGQLQDTSKPFKEGTYFSEGDLLFDIDGENARLNLLAQRSNLFTIIAQSMPDLKFDHPAAFDKWKRYLDEFDEKRNLRPLPEVSSDTEKYFIAGKNIFNLYYSIKSMENQQGKYQIYAPFSGVVTRANTYRGQLVSPGANLGTMMNTSRYELSAPIAMSDIAAIKVGQSVELKSAELGKSYTGKVSRISRVIDPTTQNLPVYISVSGRELRDGMYLKGRLAAERLQEIIVIPKDQLIDQKYVYVVEDSVIVKQQVSLIKKDANNAYLEKFETELAVITSPLSGLYEGQKVAARLVNEEL